MSLFVAVVETEFPVSDVHTHSFVGLPNPVPVGVQSRMLLTGSRIHFTGIGGALILTEISQSSGTDMGIKSQQSSYAARASSALFG